MDTKLTLKAGSLIGTAILPIITPVPAEEKCETVSSCQPAKHSDDLPEETSSTTILVPSSHIVAYTSASASSDNVLVRLNY